MNCDLRNSADDHSQRMLNAIEPSTALPIHRHRESRAVILWRLYVGLKGAETKLRKWLQDFKFVDVATANEAIDWGKAPMVRL